jgi:hypothetical protein
MFQTISLTTQVMSTVAMASTGATTLTEFFSAVEAKLDFIYTGLERQDRSAVVSEMNGIICMFKLPPQIKEDEQVSYDELINWVKALRGFTEDFLRGTGPVEEVLNSFRALRETFPSSTYEVELDSDCFDEQLIVEDPASALGAVTSGHATPQSSQLIVDLTEYSGHVTADYLIEKVILPQIVYVASGDELVIELDEPSEVFLKLAQRVWSNLEKSSMNYLKGKILLLRLLCPSEENQFQVRFEVDREESDGSRGGLLGVSMGRII